MHTRSTQDSSRRRPHGLTRALFQLCLAASLSLALPASAADQQVLQMGDASMVRSQVDLSSILPLFHPEADVGWLAPPTESLYFGGHRLHHTRMHEGARLLDQDVLVFQDHEGETIRSLGTLRPVGEPPPHRAAEADVIALALALYPEAEVVSTERLLVPGPGGYEPVHAVSLIQVNGLPARLWFDAAEEPTLRREIDLLAEYEGTVQVYETSQLYGEPVVRTVVDLEYETWLSSVDREVVDSDHSDPNPLQYDEDAAFLWEPDDWRFGIGMGFYHLQVGEEFLIERSGGAFEGFIHPDYGVVNIQADNRFDEPSLASRAGHLYYETASGWRHWFLLGTGEGASYTLNNFALDAEVWLHEQGHAVNGEVTPFFDPEQEAIEPEYGAVEEGLCDYGATIYTGDPLMLEFIAADFEQAQRDHGQFAEYPDDYEVGGDPHTNGIIVGSAGWTLRDLIGEDPADIIVLGSRHYLSSGASGLRALADGMVLADEDAHGGRYRVPVLQTLELHGIPAHADGWPAYAVPELADAIVEVGEAVNLQVGGGDADVVAYSWSIVQAPEDSTVQSIDGEARWDPVVSFVPDMEGSWVIELRVASDDWLLSEPETLEVVVGGEDGDGCACSGSASTGRGAQAALSLLLLLGFPRRYRPRTSDRRKPRSGDDPAG